MTQYYSQYSQRSVMWSVWGSLHRGREHAFRCLEDFSLEAAWKNSDIAECLFYAVPGRFYDE